MIKRSVLLLPLILLCSLLDCANARWGSTPDASIEVKQYNRYIKIKKDGTAVEQIETRFKILNESGRINHSSYTLTYNHDSSKMKVLEAKTFIKDKEYPVDLSTIENQPLASSPQGFDQSYQLMIVFPNAEINSELYLKYELEITHPPLDNFYETTFGFGFDGIWKNSTVNVSSEIPFYIDINDPTGALSVKQYTNNDLYYLDMKLNKDVFTQIFNESNAQVNPKHLTIVHLSTIKTWDTYAKAMKPGYLNVMNQELPDVYKDIANSAKDKKFTVEQIDTVTSLLAEKIRYMGDWRSHAGRYTPRDLAEVAKTQYGDCKDLSAGTAAILNSIGLKSDLVLVTRGTWVYDLPSKLAGFLKFNHMIVRVIHGAKTYWIDPTNIVSMAGEIFFDISNRKALVVTSKNPGMQQIPPINPKNHLTEIVQSIDLSDPKLYKVSGDLHYNGNAANPLTATRLFASEDYIKHYIFNTLGDTKRMVEKNIILPQLNTRIVEDLSFVYDFVERSTEIKTNAGPGILLGVYGLEQYIVAKDRVSDLYIGEPSTFKVVKTFTKIKASHKKLRGAKVRSPWLDVERRIQYNRDNIKITDSIIIKRSVITHEEYNSKKYMKMRDKLESFFTNGTAVVFDRIK